ncbi:MAG: DUF4838 domain-containing protein [Epsilonproteobacteria bacterium]|nr:DUF4838 domain-containing protein [Campylobacterota bacterium]
MLKILTLILFFTATITLHATPLMINSDTRIVYTKKTKNASMVLREYLQKIFSQNIVTTMQNSTNTPQIKLIHLYDKTIDSVIKNKLQKLRTDSFILERIENQVIIAGTNDRAIFYGVYHFLEYYLGCQFLTQEFEIIPSHKVIYLESINDVQEPHFEYREYFSLESDDLEFATKCRLNGRLGHRSVNKNQSLKFPKGKAIYNDFVSSSLINDDQYSCNGQYDFSNITVAKIALKEMQKKLYTLQIKNDDGFLLEHEDRESFCTKGIKKGIMPSEPFLKYSSYIAQSLKNKVFFQAYQWSRTPPQLKKELPTNLTIFYSPIEADLSKPLMSKTNRAIYRDLLDWTKFDREIYIWHYATNFGGYFQPYPNLYALDYDLKTFAEISNIKGIFLQSSYGTLGGELLALRNWVFSKLMWDPTLKIDKLIQIFCDAYYKDASTYVQEYIQKIDQIHQRMEEPLLLKSSLNMKFLAPPSLQYLEKILEEGLKKVANDPQAKVHLTELFSGIDYVRIMRGDGGKGVEKSKNRLKQFLTHPQIHNFYEGGDIAHLKAIIDLKRKKPSIPKLAKGLHTGKDWFDYQEYELKLCCADLVEDSVSSDGISAKMSGSEGAWGFQLPMLNFPTGKWDIYANVKINFNKDHSFLDNKAIALYYGIHPTFIKGVKLVGQFEDNVYQSVKIGSIDTTNIDADYIWLSPPENKEVKSVYVDRIYIIKNNNL